MTQRSVEQVIGENVAAYRGGTSQAALGAALAPFLGGEGWSRQTVWKAEHGLRQFTPTELLALAAVLEVTLPQLFESAEAVHLPSGRSVEVEALDALLAGTNDERERTLRLLDVMHGLEDAGKRINLLAALHAVQVARLHRAIHGSPDPDPPGADAPIIERYIAGLDRLAGRMEKGREDRG